MKIRMENMPNDFRVERVNIFLRCKNLYLGI